MAFWITDMLNGSATKDEMLSRGVIILQKGQLTHPYDGGSHHYQVGNTRINKHGNLQFWVTPYRSSFQTPLIVTLGLCAGLSMGWLNGKAPDWWTLGLCIGLVLATSGLEKGIYWGIIGRHKKEWLDKFLRDNGFPPPSEE